MPPESLPFNRKDFLKDRKPSSSDPIGIVPARLNERPTTPSQLNNHGSSSYSRWGGVGGPSDFRRPFSGQGHHGKRVTGGWHKTTDESSNKENNINASIMPMTSPNGNFHPNSDFVNSSDQHPKNNGGGISTTNSSPRLELGSSLDWKPLKWIRSGSLSSRGSSFSHQSSCKIIGVVPNGTKVDADLANNSSGDVGPPKTPDDASSRKKPRLGWGEGLAKYEKKKVDPDDLLTSPSNLSECASPNASNSFAYSSSPGVEEKESTKTVTVDDNTSNHREGSSLNLEFNSSSIIEELLQTGELNSHTAMEKLQAWKAEVSRTVEITETEIDSLENELKSLVSNESSCPVPDASVHLPTELNNETCEEMAMEKSDSSPEEEEDSDEKSLEASECSEDVGNDDMLGVVTSCEVSTDSSSTDAHSDPVSCEVYYVRQDKLNDQIVTTNKVIANEASDELSRMLLPTTTHLCTNTSKATNGSFIKEKIYTRKRFLKLKERIITSKYRALQCSWKQDVQMLSLKRIGAKSQKKFESSSRMGYADPQKNRLSCPGGSMSLVPTMETLDYVKKLLSDSRVKVYRSAVKMPCMILDKRERTMTRFISDNALVEDPIEAEKERSSLNSWTKEETKTFLENYSLFGKNFKKIASFLPKKTIAECVEFYYKNHKSDPFQKAKKYFKFSNSSTTSPTTYLVTSARRSNQETSPTSLEILGAASAMVAADVAKPPLKDFPMLCNEQEKDAADVLAGICGSVSSDALGSCVTRCQVSSLNEVDEGGCSDDSCGEEVENCDWTEEEKAKLMEGVKRYGKNFIRISRFVGTRSGNECRVFFSKARKCLGLDSIDGGSQESDHDHDHDLEEGEEDVCMVDNDNGSDISHDVVLPQKKPQVELVGERSPENTSCYRQKIRDESEERELPVRDLNLDLNESEKEVAGDGFLMTDFFPCGPDRKSDDNVSSSRLSFRKSFDNIYPVKNNGGLTYSESSPQGNLNLDKSLLMDPCLPRDFTSNPSLFQDSRKTSSSDVEKSNTSSGGVKLFGQIITKRPQEPSVVKPFDNTKLTSLNLDQRPNNNHHYNNLPSRSYGFLDGNKMQTGLGLPSSIPDSARLLAKYPAAFSKTSSFLKFDQNHQQLHSSLKMVSGFPTIIPNINNGGANYQTSGIQKGVQVHPFTIDKLLLPDMSTGKVSSSGSRGMNVISGVSVSDPVAAIRMHYAQTQQHYMNGSNGSDIHYNR